MKPLIGICFMARPKTTKRCLEALFSHTDRSKFDLVGVNQNAIPEVQEILYTYKKEFDGFWDNEFNTGIIFGNNQAMSLRRPGQSYIKLDDDVIILANNWLELFEKVLSEKDIGTCLGRRPTFWLDMPGRFEYYKSMPKEERNGIWIEVSEGGLVGCWWGIKGEVLDQLGYLNESTNNDDFDYWFRAHLAGWKSVYIPDAVCHQLDIEENTHKTAGLMKKVVALNSGSQHIYNRYYGLTKNYYLESRFGGWFNSDPGYRMESDINWTIFKRGGIE